ncbi:MAG: YciI family protein [Thermomicrobiales bacterium]
MPQYAILLNSPAPADPMVLPPEEMEAHMRYANQIEELGGKLNAPQALQPSTTATSIRGDLVTDGPFIESKEVLAGFFILDARDLDHALDIAKRCPATWRGGVEVRPLLAAPEA